jgi:hypothetical protein
VVKCNEMKAGEDGEAFLTKFTKFLKPVCTVTDGRLAGNPPHPPPEPDLAQQESAHPPVPGALGASLKC